MLCHLRPRILFSLILPVLILLSFESSTVAAAPFTTKTASRNFASINKRDTSNQPSLAIPSTTVSLAQRGGSTATSTMTQESAGLPSSTNALSKRMSFATPPRTVHSSNKRGSFKCWKRLPMLSLVLLGCS